MTALARRIVVTGGTSGIGLAAACRFAADPAARIVLNGRSAERGEAACGAVRARHPGVSVHFIAADVSSATGAAHLVAEAARHLGGGLDVLVTAAGGDYAPALFHDTPLPDIDGIVRHWLLATMYCCHFALPLMADGGAVVTVASDAAKVPTPGETVVGAAMSGIAMFSRTLAMEAKRRRIRVNVVTPSLVSGTLTHDRITAGGFQRQAVREGVARRPSGRPGAGRRGGGDRVPERPRRVACDGPGPQRERRHLGGLRPARTQPPRRARPRSAWTGAGCASGAPSIACSLRSRPSQVAERCGIMP